MPLDKPTSDLWIRLGQLERCCDVSLESYMIDERRWRWRLEISHRSNPAVPPIVVDEDSPIRALSRGLEEAETRRWHEP